MKELDPIVAPEGAVTARYTPSRIPDHKGNPLIEALPPTLEDEAVLKALSSKPRFKEEQRSWPTSERMNMLSGLSRFMMPLQQQVELFYSLENMIRSGYVGRAPRTPTHAEISQKLYDLQHSGEAFDQLMAEQTPQISTALIGLSGMGKTTTMKRWWVRMKDTIYHSATNTYQVPVLHIELPPDGASVIGLANSIFHALEQRIPRSDYVRTYTKGRPNAVTMILNAVKLMHRHCVGMLICDELHNLLNAKVNAQVLMTQLTNLCNTTGVPLLFVGTNKAARFSGIALQQARRSTGEGIATWDRLVPKTAGGNGEWEDFIGTLWAYQWIKKPVPLTGAMRQMMFESTQGIIDLTIKLFRSVQIRAMLNGTETITVELIEAVYKRDFKILHHLLDAIRTNNLVLLAKYDDIRPVDLDRHLQQAWLQHENLKTPRHSPLPDDMAFRVSVIEALMNMGTSPGLAEEAADFVIAEGQAKTVRQAVLLADSYIEKPPKTKPKKKASGTSADVSPEEDPKRFDGNQYDYRRAYAYAEQEGTTVLEQLGLLGMAPAVEEFLVL